MPISKVLNSSLDSAAVAANTIVDGSITGAKLASNTVDVTKVDTTITQLFGMRNRMINGAMNIWQRGTSFTGLTSTTYAADRFVLNMGTPGTGVFRVDQATDGPTQYGFKNAYKITPTTAMSTVAAAAYVSLVQLIEGFNCADLMYGTPYAQTITLSFWVKSNVTGIVPGTVIQNAAAAGYERAYPYVFNITAADTWQKVVVTIPGDTSGAIAGNNTWGLQFNIGYMTIGSQYQNGTINAWNPNTGGTQYIASGQTFINRASSTSNYMSFTGVQVEVGSTASSFDWRHHAAELVLCQRYFQKFTAPRLRGVSNSTTSLNRMGLTLPVTMRAAPTATSSGTHDWYDGVGTGGASSVAAAYATPDSIEFDFTAATGTTAAYRPIVFYVGASGGYVTASAEL